MRRLMAIDPGVNIGVAIWDLEYDPLTPRRLAQFSSEKKNWYDKSQDVISRFHMLVEGEGIQLQPEGSYHFAIEYPSYFMSGRGQTSADSGDLVKLCINVGRIIQICRRYPVRLVPVIEWKGTMTKTATTARIRRRLGYDFKAPSHAMDAVGIGLHVLGEF